MSDPQSFAEQFEAYLDGTLPEAQRAEIERRIADDPTLQAEVELDRRVISSLRERFAPPTPRPLDLSANAHASNQSERARPAASSFWRSRRGLGILAVAATVAWALFLWQLVPDEKKTPPFEPEPLVQLFQKTVSAGFEPYWECPPERFTATFAERQGAALQMTDMPDDRGMLGLSYPGGLSRNTTAILCQVDGQPVMVFVDRVREDREQPELPAATDVQLFRRELGPLVLYEVSKFDAPQMLDYLALAE